MNSFPAKGSPRFIDSHCHLDASEFGVDSDAMRDRARRAGVDLCLIPAVDSNNFEVVQNLAHRFNDLYAFGIHPLYTPGAKDEDLQTLRSLLAKGTNFPHKDPRLVGVGEIGLDGALKKLDWNRQIFFYEEQLKIAAQFNLPVVLHVRQSVDFVLKGLRKHRVRGGIAHAFNGSLQQAAQFIEMGFKLGFGGALTYPRALHLRRLVREVPAQSIVLETDSPDIVPVWRYVNAQERARGQVQGRNEPSDLPRIAKEIAALRGESLEELMTQSTNNFLSVFNLQASNAGINTNTN